MQDEIKRIVAFPNGLFEFAQREAVLLEFPQHRLFLLGFAPAIQEVAKRRELRPDIVASEVFYGLRDEPTRRVAEFGPLAEH